MKNSVIRRPSRHLTRLSFVLFIITAIIITTTSSGGGNNISSRASTDVGLKVLDDDEPVKKCAEGVFFDFFINNPFLGIL